MAIIMLATYTACNQKKKWNVIQNSLAVRKLWGHKNAIVKNDMKS